MTAELKAEHYRFRSQLNIYCLLALIFAGLAATCPAALAHQRGELWGELAFTLAYVTLAVVSYQAAIASARGYITVLQVLASQAAGSATPAPS